MKKRTKISVLVLTAALVVSMIPAFANAQKIPNAVYAVRNKNSGKLLAPYEAFRWDGTPIVQCQSYWGATHMEWAITYRGTDRGGEYYSFINRYTKGAIDVPGCTHRAGTQLKQWTWNSSNAQLWYIRDNGDRTYSWISRANGLFMDVSGGSSDNNARVIQQYRNGKDNQKWYLTMTSAG